MGFSSFLWTKLMENFAYSYRLFKKGYVENYEIQKIHIFLTHNKMSLKGPSFLVVRQNKNKKRLSFVIYINVRRQLGVYRVAPKKRNSRYSQFFRTLLWSTGFFFTLLDRASFPHYNNTKIIKFGWELFILWVISYGLSFSGFARFPEFRDTINDSFSSTCANTYQHQPATKKSQCQWRAWIVNHCHWTL